MLDSEPLELTCPCCSSTLGVDESGDLYPLVDNREGKAGVNGIRTHTVGGDDWQSRLYQATEPKQYRPPLTMTEPGLAGHQPTHADPELLNASRKDWRDKHISTDTNDK